MTITQPWTIPFWLIIGKNHPLQVDKRYHDNHQKDQNQPPKNERDVDMELEQRFLNKMNDVKQD